MLVGLNLSFISLLVHICGRQDNDPSREVHILIPGTCKYVTFQGKRDFADAITLRISKR